MSLRYFRGKVSIFDSFFWDNHVIIRGMNDWFANEYSFSTSSDYLSLDGQLLVKTTSYKEVADDFQVMENVWDRKQPIFREEQIELQNHGQQLWFKNVYVRELPY